MKKIHKLEETTQPDFHLIGISSYENDYRVCWELNNILGFNLKRESPIKIKNKKTDEIMEFSVFSFLDEDTFNKFHLINNRCPEGFLIETQKKTDFFVQIIGEINVKSIDQLLTKLRNSSLLQAVYAIEIKQAKSWNRLIFW